MDFHALPRRELQTLCKRNKIAANMTNVAMADALQALPTVEGLETLIQDAEQYLSPKKAAGMPEAPSRSCRRTSTRKQPNPPESSVPRTRRAAAEKEDGGEDDAVVPGVGIPNSPTTLNSRGRRTRTLVTAGCPETGEEEVEAVKKMEPLPLEIPKTPATRATRKVESLPLEITKTPATRATRGRRAANQVAKQDEEDAAPVVTQTLVTAGCPETGEEEVVEAVKKVEPLPLEIPKTPATRATRTVESLPLEITKTPATRATRGRRAANQVAKQEEEDAAPVVTQTPGVTTARRASTQRGGARAALAPVEASGARSTRYGTRRAAVEEAAAETETAAPTRTSRKNSKKAADDGVLLGDVSAAGEDSAGGDAPADVEEAAAETETAARTRTSRKNSKKVADEGVLLGDVSAAGEDSAGGDAPADVGAGEALIPVAAVGRVAAEEMEQAALSLSAEPTAEISHPEMDDGSDERRVDQTVEKNPTDVVVVEDVGVDQTAAEETISADPTVVDEELPKTNSIDQTVDKADEPADQTVEVEESHDSTVGDAPSDQTAAEEPILDNPTVVDEEDPMADSIDRTVVDKAEEPADQTVEVEEPHDSTVGDASFVGPISVEELILNIAEISLDPTADEEGLPIAAGSEDQTADDGRDLVELLLLEEEMPVDPVEVEGSVGSQEIQVSNVDPNEDDIDPTAEDGDEISACEEGEAASPEETPVEDPDAGGVLASLVTGPQEAKEEEAEEEENAAPGPVSSAVGEINPVVGEEEPGEEEEEETPPEVGDAEAAGVPVSLVADVVAAGGIQLEQAEKEENAAPGLVSSAVGEINPVEGEEEQGEEEKKKEEENTGFISIGGGPPPAETEKAADLVQTQQPSMDGDAASYLLGEQDKENAAVEACSSLIPKQNQQVEVVKFDNTTSLRKLKTVYKEVLEEKKKKKRAALTALDDNCITSPGQIV